jgi:hypothetical protein
MPSTAVRSCGPANASRSLPIGPPTPADIAEPLHLYGFAAGDGVLGSGRGGAKYQVSDDYV